MLNYIIRKLLGMIPMLLIITFLIYLGVELMPGDVMDFLIPMDCITRIGQDIILVEIRGDCGRSKRGGRFASGYRDPAEKA